MSGEKIELRTLNFELFFAHSSVLVAANALGIGAASFAR